MASVEVVAELGINHQGDKELAHRMIEQAAACGCHGVKIQPFRCEDFLPDGHPDWKMFKQAELSWKTVSELRLHAKQAGVLFGGTPSSVEGVEQLAALDVDFLKNGSDYLLRHDVIRAMAQTGIRTVISLGMADVEDVHAAERVWLEESPDRDAVWMVCTSAYPCPDNEANLARIEPGMGFSDHTIGVTAAIVASARGAVMVEKHFTVDRSIDGPDHWFSADPGEMLALVDRLQQVEALLGTGVIGPSASELRNRDKWRVREGALRAA